MDNGWKEEVEVAESTEESYGVAIYIAKKVPNSKY